MAQYVQLNRIGRLASVGIKLTTLLGAVSPNAVCDSRRACTNDDCMIHVCVIRPLQPLPLMKYCISIIRARSRYCLQLPIHFTIFDESSSLVCVSCKQTRNELLKGFIRSIETHTISDIMKGRKIEFEKSGSVFSLFRYAGIEFTIFILWKCITELLPIQFHAQMLAASDDGDDLLCKLQKSTANAMIKPLIDISIASSICIAQQ